MDVVQQPRNIEQTVCLAEPFRGSVRAEIVRAARCSRLVLASWSISFIPTGSANIAPKDPRQAISRSRASLHALKRYTNGSRRPHARSNVHSPSDTTTCRDTTGEPGPA